MTQIYVQDLFQGNYVSNQSTMRIVVVTKMTEILYHKIGSFLVLN
jgi:hypothetical protein